MPEITPETSRVRRSSPWIILGLLALAYMFIPFHRSCLSILALDIMADTGMDAVAFGGLSSAFFLTFGLMQLPAGILNDTLGPRKILPLFMGLAGLGALTMGLADNTTLLTMGRALVGFGISVIYLSNVKIVANWFPADKFAAVNGLFVSTGGLGMILASGPLAYASQWAGWRATFIGVAVACIALALFMRVYVYDRPDGREHGTLRTQTGSSSFRAVLAHMPVILKGRNFWALCVWSFCHFTLGSGFGGLWGGAYLVHVHGLDQAAAGNVLNMMGLGLFAGAGLLGWLAGSVFHSCKRLMLICSILSTAAFTILALFGDSLPLWGLYVWFFSMILIGLGPVSLAFACARQLYSAAMASTAGGLLNTLPSFGVVIIQPLTGFILKAFSEPGSQVFPSIAYSMACIPFILLGIIGGIAIVFFQERSNAD
ncbi:MFS transporter [Desulfovibrio sp. OttesenSCG-928-I05]|nr:MFS transporter [Desulfovibrio sp. OttesenSCG-928-I05]